MWTYNYLCHDGRKGMKWGQHIFGRIREANPNFVGPRRKPLVSETGLSRTKEALDATGQAVNAAKNLNSQAAKIRKDAQKKQDLSKMSDEDLKKRVSRMNLEQQYSNLTSGQTTKGHANVDRILSVAGGVLAMGASAVSIALMMKQMKGG